MSTEERDRIADALQNCGHERCVSLTTKECLALADAVVPVIATYRAELIGAAYLAAATHQPMIAIDHSASKVWVYCSCGFNRESDTYETDPEKWGQHIISLTPADSERAMALRVAEARLEAVKYVIQHAPGRLPSAVTDYVEKLEDDILELGGKL